MLLILSLHSCVGADGVFEEKQEQDKTRLYVYNNLNSRFFALINAIYIRDSLNVDHATYREFFSSTDGSKNLLLNTEGEKTTVIEGNFWRTELLSCDTVIDLQVIVDDEDIYEYRRLPVKCGEDYKFVIYEPAPVGEGGVLQGCMQTTSEASMAEDPRIKEKCGIGVDQ